jgi:hypothetical protein
MDNGEFYIYKMIDYDAIMDLVHKLFYCQRKLFDEVRDDLKQAPVKKDVSSWKHCYEAMGDFILQTPSFLQYHQHHAGLMYDTTEGCKLDQQNIIGSTEYLQRSLPLQSFGNNDRSQRVSSEGMIYDEDQEKKGWLPSIFKKGGKYVASGTYGCVFSPPIKCTVHKTRFANKLYDPRHKVGKVFSHAADAVDEKILIEKIRKIDPKHEWTVPMHLYCSVKHFAPKDEKNRCPLLSEDVSRTKVYPQLIYEKGGKDLYKWVKKAIIEDWSVVKKRNLFVKMCENLRPVLVGLKKLNDAHLLHADIKPGNMLFDGKKMYVIDFGLMRTSKNFYTFENRHLLKHNYLYYPPEFKIFAYSQQSSDTSFHFKKYLENYGFNHKQEMASKYDSIKKTYSIMLDSLKEKGKGSKQLNVNNLGRIFNKSVDRVDVYSLGMTLYDLYRKLVVENTEYTIKMKFLIEQMILIDFRKRLDWDTVIRIYDKIHST